MGRRMGPPCSQRPVIAVFPLTCALSTTSRWERRKAPLTCAKNYSLPVGPTKSKTLSNNARSSSLWHPEVERARPYMPPRYFKDWGNSARYTPADQILLLSGSPRLTWLIVVFGGAAALPDYLSLFCRDPGTEATPDRHPSERSGPRDPCSGDR